MENNQLTRGLELLADEAEARPVDVHHIITKAKARTRNRHATIAVGGATVALVGALATVTMGTAPTSTQMTRPSPSTDSSPVIVWDPSGTAPLRRADSNGQQNEQPKGPAIDERSRKLTNQFEAARAQLIPPQFTLEPYTGYGSPRPLRFEGGWGGSTKYTFQATLRDSEGYALFDMEVLKAAPGTPLQHYYGQVFGPCEDGEDNCQRRTLPDGTVAAAQVNARPPGLTLSNTLTAQRPDGTYIQVVTNVGAGGRATPPLTIEDMFKFATAFTY